MGKKKVLKQLNEMRKHAESMHSKIGDEWQLDAEALDIVISMLTKKLQKKRKPCADQSKQGQCKNKNILIIS